jgi:hypothetical protein
VGAVEVENPLRSPIGRSMMKRDRNARASDSAVLTRREGMADRAREFHDALSVAIEGLERALAAAAATRVKPWSERVAIELDLVREAIAAHAANIEETDGLLREIAIGNPRLATRVRDLKSEHIALLARADGIALRLPADHDADFAGLRREIGSLLTALRAHRATETDLVFEAFWTDLGAPH